jgi:RHS repeat-associated protein
MKLRKTVNNTGAVTLYKQDYVSGLEYRSNGSAGALTLEAIYHPEGRITPDGAAFRYEYNIKDHLGNTRLTFADINSNGAVDITGVATTTEILSENHYYPFGMNMGYDWMNNTAISPDTKYQYNGKEYNDDFGLNWNDYGARWYDGSLGRWMSVDPLAEKTANINTYSYVKSNPMLLLDRDGMLWVNPYKSQGADYKDQADAVDAILNALKTQDTELYDFINNLKFTNENGDEQALTVRVYLSDADRNPSDLEAESAEAATPIGYSKIPGKYNGNNIQIPHGDGFSSKQKVIGKSPSQGGGGDQDK